MTKKDQNHEFEKWWAKNKPNSWSFLRSPSTLDVVEIIKDLCEHSWEYSRHRFLTDDN